MEEAKRSFREERKHCTKCKDEVSIYDCRACGKASLCRDCLSEYDVRRHPW